jgi:hypothetical protein
VLYVVEGGKNGSPSPLNFEITRALIARQPGVVDADVWEKNGSLLSRVVISDDSRLCGSDIQQVCLRNLGATLTPRMVVIEHIRRLVA